MKTLIAAIVLAIFATTAQASEHCTQVNDIAWEVVTARQNGVSAQKLMEMAEGNRAVQGMIKEAYASPRYSTAEFQKRAADEMANTWYMACLSVEERRDSR